MAEEEESLVERICRLEREKEVLVRQLAAREKLIVELTDTIQMMRE